MEATQEHMQEKGKVGEVPSYLIYEIIDGRPIYRKGYKAVLHDNKNPEEIMGSSGLQAVIIDYILRICYACFDAKNYRVLTNELGAHHGKSNNMAHDIAVFEKEVLTADKIKPKYVDVPAKVIFEIDLAVELEDMTEHEYVHTKVQKMLDFGTERVFWITTKTQKVLLATPGENWQIIDWNKDIVLYGDYRFNVGRYLEEEGIRLDEESSGKIVS